MSSELPSKSIMSSPASVSLTGASTTDDPKLMFSIKQEPANASCQQPHDHSHGHGHEHQTRPMISLNVPAAQLVTQYENDPPQLFQILLYIVKMGSFELFHDIVEKVKDVSSILPLRDSHGHSLLHWAAKRPDQVQFVQYLLQPNNNHNKLTPHSLTDDETGMTPLHWACTEPNNLVIIQHLLGTHNDSLELRDGTGCTPLLIAAQHGHVETCAFLLQRGANRQAHDTSRDTAMHWAAYKGSLMVLGLLSYYDASNDMLCQPDVYGQTPLHLAALRGHVSVCRYIVQQVLSNSGSRQAKDLLLLKDKNGRTPYALAVHKDKPTVAALLKHKMDLLTVPPNKQWQATIQRNVKNIVSWSAWKAWLGISDSVSDDIDESPQFPYFYVKFHVVANLVYYFTVFLPVHNPGAGVLWDKTGLHVIMMLLLGAAVYCLYRTNTTNPGQLNDTHANIQYWRRGYEQTLEAYAKNADDAPKDVTLCHTCHIVRPPRSKHDRYTHVCVLLFDHHCPFVGNTVGLYNYKWFYLFLVTMTCYLALLLFVMLVLYCKRVSHTPVGVVLMGVFLGLHGLISGGMLIYHTQLTFMNLTTNEHLNLRRYEYFWESRQDGGRRFHNPWNRGWMANFLDRWAPSEASYMLQRQQPTLTLEMETLLDRGTNISSARSFESDHVV